MTISPWLGYLGASALVGAVSRIWVLFKRDRRARRAYSAPLFPDSDLKAALAPVAGDDPNVLLEIGGVLSHLNRQTFAEELWRIDEQLEKYYVQLPQASRATMRGALMRLLGAGDRWLTIISAKTCARIGFPEAEPKIRAIVESLRIGSSEADERFAAEIRAALERLTDGITARK